jgi:Apea-like HEPN
MRVFGQPGPGVVWNKNGVYSNITARLKSKEKFQFRQRPSLQIDRFLSTFNDATMEAIGIDKSTAGEIAKIRHEMTHALSRGNPGSPIAPIEIYKHTYRMRFLAFIYLLKEAGLNERDCVYGLGGSDEFRWLVDFDAFNHPKHSWGMPQILLK